MDGSQRICRFVQTASHQPFAVGTDSNGADAPEIDLLTAVVRMQRRGIECSYFFARGRFPLLEAADKITAEEKLALRMKRHGIHMSRVSRQFANQTAVADVPQPNDVVVAAADQQRAVRD